LSIRDTRTAGNNVVDQDITLTNVCFGGNKATGDDTQGGAGYFKEYDRVIRVNVGRDSNDANSADICDGLFLDDEVGNNRCVDLGSGENCNAQDDLPTR
jgi:hypothetical protein